MIEQAAFSVEKVLMEGLRMLDEWRTFPIEVQSEGHVFRNTKSGKADSEVQGEAAEILRLLDGRRSVRQVVDASRRTTFEVGRHLSEAFSGGRIETVEAASAKKNPFSVQDAENDWQQQVEKNSEKGQRHSLIRSSQI